jgi:hypothetical protein
MHCSEAMRLLGAYRAALGAFHSSGPETNAEANPGREKADVILLHTQQRFLEHVRLHGCQDTGTHESRVAARKIDS